MHKKIMQKAAKALDKDAKHYKEKEKRDIGTKLKHDKIEEKEAKAGAKDMKKKAKKAHEY